MNDVKRQQSASSREMHDPQTRALDDVSSGDVDETSEASFPASDPPAWTGLRVGRPSPDAEDTTPSPPAAVDSAQLHVQSR
jgi:hypothetical protein